VEDRFAPGLSDDELVAIARSFNDAWNSGNVERVVGFFAPDATVRIVPPPAPPEPDRFTGDVEIRGWVARTLSLPFEVLASNYRVAGPVVTWDAVFPNEGADAAPDVSEAVFDGRLIVSFTP
jgi:hypothetical protein